MAGTDFTTLGIGVNSEGVKVAEKDLKDMAAAAKQAEKDATDLEKAMTRATTKGVVFGTMIADAAFKVLDLAGQFLNLGLSISKYQDLAEQTQSDPAGLANLQIVADIAGVSIDNIAMAMSRLSSRLVKANPETGQVTAAVKALGLEFEALKKLSPEEQYRAIAAALSKFADGSEKVAIAQGLFGLNGAMQLRVMKELNEHGTKANLLTNEQIKLADDVVDRMTQTRSEAKQLAQAFMANANPAIDAVTKGLRSFFEELVGVGSEATRLKANTSMRDFAFDAAESLVWLLEVLTEVKKGLQGIAAFTEFAAGKMAVASQRTVNQGARNVAMQHGSPADRAAAMAAEAGFDELSKEVGLRFDKRVAEILNPNTLANALKVQIANARRAATDLDGMSIRDRKAMGRTDDLGLPTLDTAGMEGGQKKIKEVVDVYEQLMDSIRRKNSAQLEELAIGRELTTYEKMRIDMAQKIEAANERAIKAKRPQDVIDVNTRVGADKLRAIDQEIQAGARAIDANKARADAEKAAAKEAEQAAKDREKSIASLIKEAETNEKSTQSLLEQTNAVGKTKAEIESLAVTRLLDEAATKAQNIAISETTRNEVDAARAVVDSLIARASATSAYSVALETQARIEKNLHETNRTERDIVNAQRMLETYGMTREEIYKYEMAQRRRIAAEELLLTKSDESSFAVDAESDSIRRKALAVIHLTDVELALIALYERDKVDPAAGAKRAMNQYSEDAKDIARSTEEAVSRISRGIEDNLVSGIMHGKMAWGDLIEYMLQEALRLMVIKPMLADLMDMGQGKQGGGWLTQLFGAVAGYYGGGGGGGGDAGTSLVATMTGTGHGAKGAVIDSSMPTGQEGLKFARGGIVDSPTPFKFAAGGSVQSGLMGEAGPEGILPLERGPGGKLGVHASGGGGSTTVTVNHYNNFGSGVSPSQFAQGLAQNREQTKAEISDQIRRGSRAYSR